jgi:hypothetical protein
MFGVIKGQGIRLSCAERRDWTGHVCGLCLALRNSSGQVARLTTNLDAALLSVLYDALTPEPAQQIVHHCPLRRGGQTRVVDPANRGARFAASIALLSSATKIEDHLADQDSWLRFLPRLFARLAEKWRRAARAAARRLGFAVEEIDSQTRRQLDVESQPGRPFEHYSAPTEQAVAAACRHTALLARTPRNLAPLQAIGQMFGRIMYLVDAYEDLEADERRGKFNPLAQCYPRREVRKRAWALFAHAHQEIRTHFSRLELKRPTLARQLLIDQLARVGRQTFRVASAPEEGPVPEEPPPPLPSELQAQDPPPLPLKHGTSNASAFCTGCDPDWSDVCDGIDCCTSGLDCSGLDCGALDCGGCSGCDCSCG